MTSHYHSSSRLSSSSAAGHDDDNHARAERTAMLNHGVTPGAVSPLQTERQLSRSPLRSLHSTASFYERDNRHPPTPAALPIPASAYAAHRGLSPVGTAYHSESRTTSRRQSNYYDPTSDTIDRVPQDQAMLHGQQVHASQARAPYSYQDDDRDSQAYQKGEYTPVPIASLPASRSPVSHTISHGRASSVSQSPRIMTATSPNLRHSNGMPAILNPNPTPSPKITARVADPMSFSSILSNADPAPQPPSPVFVSKPRKTSRNPASSLPQPEEVLQSASNQVVSPTESALPTPRVPAKRLANGHPKKEHSNGEESSISEIIAKLDNEKIDLELHSAERTIYRLKSQKRRLETEESERARDKVRRDRIAANFAASLGRHARSGEERYRVMHYDDAAARVHEIESRAEKERKKDMQRKRRREKAIQTNLEQKAAALDKAKKAADDTERRKFEREAERAEKKAQQTKLVLERGDRGPEMRVASPLPHNLDGGIMSSFSTESPTDVKVKGKGARTFNRLKKSKEQKQAEKDSAEAAQAAIDAGEDLPAAPEPIIKIKIGLKPRTENLRTESPAPAQTPVEPYRSKMYNAVYDGIWKDIAKRDVNKVSRLAVESQQTRMSNFKKTAILAAKEAKRWQLRTNKGTKDLQARAKRVMREMMTFWKRNERDERDQRKAAERAEIENAKKAEADREANRQKRKLNFLISQTELYSHFIGKKIKTDEVERSTDLPGVAASQTKIVDTNAEYTTDLADTGATPAKVTNFEDLDFDAEDDTVLKAAAAANAQNAIMEAQNKARAFNNDSGMDEEGEMNFQNPAGMGDVDIEQPKMLQAQLKEYQLKGLNWMVNLYEQGINGILADEMGLGKTVQSISVMAYLAEKHGIYGPFLVVAPASTLHNWEQEIRKFVPSLKVLPYWGNAADRKVLRKFWDRKHPVYTREAPFHVMVTSYQLVVSDVAYFQKMRWQYMILDEAQAIKSSQSSRWKSLLGFHCRNRLLLTGTPIQNNMQELWALLHFIMPSLFDSHDEFSEWFSKDIESHTQSNTKLNEDQLKRLHMILKPFMLRRVKKHVQKELGDKIEIDLFCDLTYRQRAYYSNLRNQISFMDLIEKATMGDDNDSGTLMNLVMQFRKVCNHPDLFERAETTSSYALATFAETGSFMREGPLLQVPYSTKNVIDYTLPRLVWQQDGRLDLPCEKSEAGTRRKWLDQELNIWKSGNTINSKAFNWARLSGVATAEIAKAAGQGSFARAVDLVSQRETLYSKCLLYEDDYQPVSTMLRIVDRKCRKPLAEITTEGYLARLLNVAKEAFAESGMSRFEQCGRSAATAPPIEVYCSSRGSVIERENTLFNVPVRRALYGPNIREERALIEAKVPTRLLPQLAMMPDPTSEKQRYTNITVPSMRRFVTDSGKLAKLDKLLTELKEGGHRVLLYFQMTRMIDLMEEYLTYRNYKYCRLDGSTKLEDRRDTVHDFQTRPEIFIFLLSTRAGGLGINLTSADTVIFYDSDWNPTIDSQAMDRAHRLGQTRQVTVYRMITRGTIEERIRKRALQKEEVQKVVMTGGAGGGVDFNARSKENRTKDIALWLADDEQAEEIERKEKELAEQEAKEGPTKKRGKKRKEVDRSLEDMYHEGEGHFEGDSAKPSGAATPVERADGPPPKKVKKSKKAKTAKQRLAMVDGAVDGMDIDLMDGGM